MACCGSWLQRSETEMQGLLWICFGLCLWPLPSLSSSADGHVSNLERRAWPCALSKCLQVSVPWNLSRALNNSCCNSFCNSCLLMIKPALYEVHKLFHLIWTFSELSKSQSCQTSRLRHGHIQALVKNATEKTWCTLLTMPIVSSHVRFRETWKVLQLSTHLNLKYLQGANLNLFLHFLPLVPFSATGSCMLRNGECTVA